MIRDMLPLLALCAACGGGSASDDAGDNPADSAPIVIDVGEAAITELPEWHVDSAPLVIGMIGGAPAYLLNRTGMPWMLGNGTIVVPNNQSEIRWFDSTGTHIRTVGQRGQGPGDFGQLWNVYPIEADTILAADAALNRISVFDSAGRFIRVHSGPPADYPIGVHWLPDRTMVFSRGSRLPEMLAKRDTGVFVDSILLILARPGEAPHDTIGRVKGAWVYVAPVTAYTSVKFSGVPLLAAGRSAIVVGHGDEFTLRWLDPSGHPLRVTRVSVAARPVPRDMIAAFEAEVGTSSAAGTRGEMPSARRMPHAEHLPFITRLVIDRSDRTWARRGAPDDASVAQWIVFNVDGAPLARVMLPVGFLASDAGDDYVLGRHTDADGVQSVRRYRLSGPRTLRDATDSSDLPP
jgi:hypothetical protein